MELSKKELRARIRLARNVQRVHFDFAPLLSTPEFQDAKVIASYRAYGDEPETRELNRLILEAGKILLLPELLPDKNLRFIEWNGLAKLEPKGQVEVPMGKEFAGKIDLIVIPSLAVDATGTRLGQGGGSYDRFLANSTGWRVAIINADEFLPVIPNEPHDIRVDAALLPDRLVRL